MRLDNKDAALHEVLSLCDRSADTTIHVPLRVDGSSYVVAMQLDRREHHRRQALNLGAVTSTGLLHALWELPHGIAVSRSKLSALDRETLETDGNGWVEATTSSITRSYQPAGRVHSLAIADRSLSRAVQRVAAHPPTTERLAVWQTPRLTSLRRIAPILERARSLGIGVLCHTESAIDELVAPAESTIGRPAVFRWWQSELAYRNWFTRIAPTAQAVTTGGSRW